MDVKKTAGKGLLLPAGKGASPFAHNGFIAVGEGNDGFMDTGHRVGAGYGIHVFPTGTEGDIGLQRDGIDIPSVNEDHAGLGIIKTEKDHAGLAKYRQCYRRGKAILPPFLPPVCLSAWFGETGRKGKRLQGGGPVWAFVRQENKRERKKDGKAENYLLQSLSSVITGMVQDSENRIARMDFKLAVEILRVRINIRREKNRKYRGCTTA